LDLRHSIGSDFLSVIRGECLNTKHLKNVGPIRHCEPPPHCHSPGVARGVTRRLHIDVHDDNDDNDNDNA